MGGLREWYKEITVAKKQVDSLLREGRSLKYVEYTAYRQNELSWYSLIKKKDNSESDDGDDNDCNMNDIDSNLKKNNSRNNKNNHNNNYDDDVDGDNVHDRDNDNITAILVVIERQKKTTQYTSM